MTALDRVRRARAMLAGAVVSSAGLWACAAGLGVYAVTLLIVGRDWWPLSLGGVAAVVVLLAGLWRGRAVWSLERTALWVETRKPELEYALVTAIAPGAEHVAPDLERVITAVAVDRVVRHAGLRVVGRAAAAAVAGVAALALATLVPGRGALAARDSLTASAAGRHNRLTPLVVRVTPPAYARQATRSTREPTSVKGLVGSAVDVSGEGTADGIRAAVAQRHDAVHVLATGSGWTAHLTMPQNPTVLRLTDGPFARVVGLDPVEDNPPTVRLASPTRDSTIRVVRGRLQLEARATDDLGLRDGYFELIVSSGEQEGSFKGVDRRVAYTDLQGGDEPTREAVLRSRVDLATVGLASGGLLSIRAVARDGNTVSGPGVGTSETRTYRVARPHESDSIGLEGVPPPALDSTYLSQRMIVIRTRALVRAGGRLLRDTVVRRSRELADKEDQLRERLRQLLGIAADEEADTTAGTAAGGQRALFDTAYRVLGDASRELTTGRPPAALAPELVALRVPDAARVARRLYLRGAPPTIVVNTARVRLSGTDHADASRRTPHPAADSLTRLAMQHLDRALERLDGLALGVVDDSLAQLRAELLNAWPVAAAAVGEALDALRVGRRRDARVALARARRALSGASSVDRGLSTWDGAWGGEGGGSQ